MFYSLLAMVATYAMFGGISIADTLQANLSKLAMRFSASPVKRFRSYVSRMLMCIVFNTISNLLYVYFVLLILKIPFITNFTATILLIIYANILGASLGLCIGSIPIGTPFTKTIFCVFTSLALSLLAGMINPSIKIAIDTAVPILEILNPISLLTGNLYNINILQEYSLIVPFLAVYTGFIGICLCIAFLNSRKVCYDSL